MRSSKKHSQVTFFGVLGVCILILILRLFVFLATGNRLSTVFVIAKTTLLFPFTLTPATLCI